MKRYIGDGVYAESREGRIVLTTEDGIDVTNTIYLEVEEARSLLQHIKGWLQETVRVDGEPSIQAQGQNQV